MNDDLNFYFLLNMANFSDFVTMLDKRMWGISPPLDLPNEIHGTTIHNDEEKILNIVTVGSGDARHIVKSLSKLKKDSHTKINFHTVESSPEHIGRSILLLSICLQKDLGLQESCRYYLEILGNTLLTPGTAKFLTKILYQLIDIVTQTISCFWLDLDSLKYKDRDSIESIFKFWLRTICEGIPIVQYWDRRIRKSLGTRYDYREGVFDWDYHMVLKSRKISHLTLQEYRFWRNNGIAFTWLETEPSRNNSTLISNIIRYREGFIHGAYTGDIVNGPYLTWAQDELDENEKLRATDKAERQLMKAIYQMRNREKCPEDIIAAHRDQSVLNGTLVTEMPDIEIEQEFWIPAKQQVNQAHDANVWIDLKNVKVIFHPQSYLEKYKTKKEWQNKFDIAFVAHNMINHLVNIASLIKKGSIIIVESPRFLVEVRKEQQDKFAEELLKIAHENGMKEFVPFNPHEDNFCRLITNETAELSI